MSSAMKNATKAMVTMNKRMNLPQLTAIMRSFGVEIERLDATQDIMGDSIDDALGGADDEEEEDAIVKQVRSDARGAGAAPRGGLLRRPCYLHPRVAPARARPRRCLRS